MGAASDEIPTLRPAKSIKVKLADGSKVVAFPSRDDYIEACIEKGLIAGEAELASHTYLSSYIFFDWVKTLHCACYFAKGLADDPASYGWQPIVIGDALKREDIGAYLTDLLDKHAEAGVEAVIAIFPDVVTPSEIAALLGILNKSDRFYLSSEVGGAEKDSVPVGLRWLLPQGNAVNHVLGFAPIFNMPPTRIAPFTALAFRIRPEISDFAQQKASRKIENGSLQVHLAYMPYPPAESFDHFDGTWQRTQKLKAKFSPISAAKLTFQLPKDIDHLIPPPIQVTVYNEE